MNPAAPAAVRSSFRQHVSFRRLTLTAAPADVPPREASALLTTGTNSGCAHRSAARRQLSILPTPCPSLTSHRDLTAVERRLCEERFKEVPVAIDSLQQLRALLHRCGQQLDVADLVPHLESIGFHFSSETQYMNLDTFLKLMSALKAQYVEQLEDPDLDMLDAFTAMGGHAPSGGRVSSTTIAAAIQVCGLPADAVPEALLGHTVGSVTTSAGSMDFLTFKQSLMATDEAEENMSAVGTTAVATEGGHSDDEEDDGKDPNPPVGPSESVSTPGQPRKGSFPFSFRFNEVDGLRRGPTPTGEGAPEAPQRRARSKAEIKLRAILQGHEDRLGGHQLARRPTFPTQRRSIIPLTRPKPADERPWRPTKPRAPSCLRRFEEEQQRLHAAALDETGSSQPPTDPTVVKVHRRLQRRPCSASPGFGRPTSASLAHRGALQSDSPPPVPADRLPFLLRQAAPTPLQCAELDPSDVDWFLLPPNLPPRAGGRYLLQDPRRAAEVFLHEGHLIQTTPFAYIDLGPTFVGGRRSS